MIRDRVIYNKLAAICREMGAALPRLSRSLLIAEDQSFATAVLDGQSRLLAQVQGDPGHLYAVRASVRCLVEYFAYDIAEGDVLLVADPFFGGTMGNALTVARPVFEGGQHTFTIAIRIPLLDLAGEQPGAYQPQAFEMWQEALRVTPVKLYRAGALQKDVLRFLVRNCRTPDILQADLQAIVATCARGERELRIVLARYQSRAVEQAVAHSFEYTRAMVCSHMKRLGVCDASATVGPVQTDAGNVTIAVSLSFSASRVHISFEGCSRKIRGALNTTRQLAQAAAVLPLLAGVLDELAINDAMLDSFSFAFVTDSVVDPSSPAAFSLGGLITSHWIAAAVTDAMRAAGASAELVPALHGLSAAAVLFAPVGQQSSNVPLYLQPGFATAACGWGAPALSGNRRLVSAEELEAQRGLQLTLREMDDEGNVVVQVRNRAERFECTFVAIGGLKDQARPTIRFISPDTGDLPHAVTGIELSVGQSLEFRFPCVTETRNA